MHMVIRAIVYAQNEQEGLVKAKRIFEDMCENTSFDYYTTFDQEGSPVSGKGGWGNLPAIVLADSKEGKELIEEGMRFTKNEFLEHLKIVRNVLASKSDEKIFATGLDEKMFQHHCYCLGQYQGSSVWLYDNEGFGIKDEKHLKNVLDKWDSNEQDDLKIFVVPAGVHC